ncbi:MAG: T9SS type A sorting domain-containing protein [Flavobacteriales bacterium]|nr:T9SS type A sorting domain-containing protein [Flavobacteriales bacterium]
MIRNLLLVGVLLAGTGAIAQNIEVAGATEVSPISSGAHAKALDTVWEYMDRGSNFYAYSAPAGGNAIGNGFVDFGTGAVRALDGIGMHFDGVTGATVTEVLVWFAQADVMGTAAESITGNVYVAASDSTPGSSLGTGTITTADADLAGGLTAIVLTSTVATGGADFVATVEWASVTMDSIGIVGSADGDGLGESRVITLASAASGFPGWFHGALYSGFDLDVMILPVMDIVAGVAEQGNISLEPAYPNPALNNVNISFGLITAEEVSVSVFNQVGQVVYSEQMKRVAGKHSINLNTSEFAGGSYYFTVKTNSAQITSKFVVSK